MSKAIIQIYQQETNQLITSKELFLGQSLKLGRNSDNDIVIADNTISGNHLTILFDNHSQKLFIVDNNSTNGSFLGNIRLVPNQNTEARHGSKIFLSEGNYFIQVAIPHQPRVQPDPKIKINITNSGASSPDSHKKPEFKPITPDSKIKMRVNSIQRNFSIGEQVIQKLNQQTQVILGRDATCDIILQSLGVSRQHTKIEKVGQTYYVTDMGSTNGTFVNRQKITKKIQVTGSGIVNIDKYEFKLTQIDSQGRSATPNPPPSTANTTIDVMGISKKYPNGYMGLKNISLDIKAGEFVAIMGPSGCGKSTLLRALNGESPATTGKVLIDGKDLQQNYDIIKQSIGYVPQDDIVHKQLTVQEALYFTAKLRLPSDVTDTEINATITEVLDMLLIPHIREKQIKSVSGGQRKRVCIALELMRMPDILFLDEPTSPLDPQTIDEFLLFLRELSRDKGITVIMVTHKPDDLKSVDKVAFMGHGMVTFFDHPGKSDVYFGKDIIGTYAILSDSSQTNTFAQKYNQSINRSNRNYSENSNTKTIGRTGSQFRQWYWLTRRFTIIKTRDKTNLIALYIISVILSLLLGSSEHDEISKTYQLTLFIILFLNISLIWFGMFNSAAEIVSEAAIYRRERMYNLRLFPYLLSKIIVLWIITFIQLIIFLGGVSMFVSFNNLPLIAGILSLVTLVSVMIGLFISSISNSTEKVMTFLPFVVIVQILFSGSNLKINNSFYETVSWTMISRWGIQGTATVQDSCQFRYSFNGDGLEEIKTEEDKPEPDTDPEKEDNTQNLPVGQPCCDQLSEIKDKQKEAEREAEIEKKKAKSHQKIFQPRNICDACPITDTIRDKYGQDIGYDHEDECYLTGKINGQQLKYFKSDEIPLNYNLLFQVLMFLVIFIATLIALKNKDQMKIKW